jgi:hypothetical protein
MHFFTQSEQLAAWHCRCDHDEDISADNDFFPLRDRPTCRQGLPGVMGRKEKNKWAEKRQKNAGVTFQWPLIRI